MFMSGDHCATHNEPQCCRDRAAAIGFSGNVLRVDFPLPLRRTPSPFNGMYNTHIYIYTHIHIYFLHGSDRRYRLPFRLRTRPRFYFLFLPSRKRKVYRWYSIPDSILESCVLRINVNHNLGIQSYESSKCMQPFIPRIEKETNPKKMNERGKTRLAKNLLRR